MDAAQYQERVETAFETIPIGLIIKATVCSFVQKIKYCQPHFQRQFREFAFLERPETLDPLCLEYFDSINSTHFRKLPLIKLIFYLIVACKIFPLMF